MAQQGAIELPGVHIPLSLSERPVWYRAFVKSRDFCFKKPLGGIGVAIIVIVVLAALLAPFIQRYNPNHAFDVEKANAAMALTDGRPTLAIVQRDTYLDGRHLYINFRTDMARAQAPVRAPAQERRAPASDARRLGPRRSTPRGSRP